MSHTDRSKKKIKKFITVLFWVLFGAVAIAALALLFGYVVMLLWNWLMPPLFGLGMVNFWQAVGIVVLAKLLFGGFSSGKHGARSKRMKSRFKERCAEKGFSKWQHYDQFWEEEGKASYKAYLQRIETREDSGEE